MHRHRQHCSTPEEIRFYDVQGETARVGVREVLETVEWLEEKGFVGPDFRATLLEVAHG
jgi:hypothetical protein